MLTALLCASAAVFTAPPKDPIQMAFVARFYSPVGSKKTSHSEVYVSDLKGGHLKQLTHGANALEIYWLDRNRLVFTKEDDTSVEYTNLLWQMNSDGTRQRKASSSVVKRFSDAGLIDPHISDYLVRNRTDISVFPPPDGESDESLQNRETWLYKKAKMSNITIPEEHERGSFDYLVFDHQTRHLWSAYWTTCSTTGQEHWIGKWDSSKNGFTFPVIAGQSIDFDIRRNLYAYTTARDLAPYDKKRHVWVSKLFVGDQTTGKIRQIDYKKLVQFFSVSLRTD